MSENAAAASEGNPLTPVPPVEESLNDLAAAGLGNDPIEEQDSEADAADEADQADASQDGADEQDSPAE